MVRVEQGAGHEYHNVTSETQFYGPYTEYTAECLAVKLNQIYEKIPGRENPIATAMPLEAISPTDVLGIARGLAAICGDDSDV